MNPNYGSSGIGSGSYNPNLGTGLGTNIGNPNLSTQQPFTHKNIDDPAMRWNFQAVPGCPKCAGHGSYRSKLKLGKLKLCKKCMTAKGYCPKCNGSGFKNSDANRPCRCGKKKVKTGPSTGLTGTSGLGSSGTGTYGSSGYPGQL